MDKKRKLEMCTQGEPINKTLKTNPIQLKNSISTTVPLGIKCLICAAEIPPRSEAQILQDQDSTVRLLGQLLRVLKLSPEVCRRLLKNKSSTVTVLYCESCEKAISSCLKIAQEIDNLHHEWEKISNEIKKNIIEDNHCKLDSSGNAYVRKTLVQYWTTCTVRIDALPANKSKNDVSTLIKGNSQQRLNPAAESNSFSFPGGSVTLGDAVAAYYSSKTSVGPDNFVDKIIEEIGSPRPPSPALSDLSESDKKESSTPAPLTFKSVDSQSTESGIVKEATELGSGNPNDSADEDDKRSLLSRVSVKPRRCQEQIVNYFCDVKMGENISESGSQPVHPPDSPFEAEKIIRDDQHKPFPDGNPKSTKKVTRKKALKKPDVSKKPQKDTSTCNSSKPKEKPEPNFQISSVSTLRLRPKHRLQEFPFNCSICGKGYHQKSRLTTHEEAHEKAHECSGSFPFSCSKCNDLRFISAASLIRHNAICHKTSSVPRRRRKAKEVVTVEETKATGPTLDEPNPPVAKTLHTCKKCNLTFEDASTLKNHYASSHEIPRNVSCPECPEKFTNVNTARNHQIRFHGKSLKTTFDIEGSLDYFQCVYCKEEFVKSSFIIEDNSTDPPTKKFSFPDLPAIVPRSRKNELSNNDEPDFKSFHWNHRLYCKSRPRFASVQDRLDAESNSAAKNSCKFCQKEFSTPHTLRNHEITVHTKDFKFHCGICGGPFPSRSKLNTHQKVHGDRRFKCEQCPKTFKTNHELKNHMNMHNNIRPYVCEQCGKAYCTSTILYMHRKQSHKN